MVRLPPLPALGPACERAKTPGTPEYISRRRQRIQAKYEEAGWSTATIQKLMA
jgi:hypothetical protein